MDRLWMAVSPGQKHTRVLVTDGPRDTLLKARLCAQPGHDRALYCLIEGLALWQRRPVHAVIAVDSQRPLFDSNRFADRLGYDSTPLYTVEPVLQDRRRCRREISGIGDFHDLHRLLHHEVAR